MRNSSFFIGWKELPSSLGVSFAFLHIPAVVLSNWQLKLIEHPKKFLILLPLTSSAAFSYWSDAALHVSSWTFYGMEGLSWALCTNPCNLDWRFDSCAGGDFPMFFKRFWNPNPGLCLGEENSRFLLDGTIKISIQKWLMYMKIQVASDSAFHEHESFEEIYEKKFFGHSLITEQSR